jgi:hypothetical protein
MPVNPSPGSPRRQDHLLEYFKNHSREVIAYALLIIGILLLFFQPVIGGIIIGIVAGIYFADEIVAYIVDWRIGMDAHVVTKHLICAGVALAFFISAPAIFLGAAIAIGIKQLFVGQNTGTTRKP